MILTQIGEVGIEHGDELYLLRPSLLSMSRLGTPEEIVATFKQIIEGKAGVLYRDTCAYIIASCTDKDVLHLTGYYTGDGYVDGELSPNEMAIIAQHLMLHGLIGVSSTKRKASGKDEYSDAFNAIDYVSLAMAHLGVSERDAWGMTMTGLVNAMAAKFPPTEEELEAEMPSQEEIRAAREHFLEVRKRRIAKAEQDKANGLK